MSDPANFSGASPIDILRATNRSVLNGFLGGKYEPLPKVPLEELLSAQRTAPDNMVRSDPRILALLYAYENYDCDVGHLLEVLASTVPGSCASLMAGEDA